MTYELLVGMEVTDPDKYQQYRDHMLPILQRFGGGFRQDFWVAETLKTDAAGPVNRVFCIYFRDQQACKDFFADPEYLQIKQRFYQPAVGHVAQLAAYERDE